MLRIIMLLIPFSMGMTIFKSYDCIFKLNQHVSNMDIKYNALKLWSYCRDEVFFLFYAIEHDREDAERYCKKTLQISFN